MGREVLGWSVFIEGFGFGMVGMWRKENLGSWVGFGRR